MAGAGYKLFQTGDVLTAAQVNTYLNEQTVMVFASAAARTSALTSVLAEGMVSYLQDTNAVEVYDGSAWVSIGASGDITGVTAGTGISGGGTSGTVTITNAMATEITAAGDIIVGTGSGTFDNLPIGTTGQVLTADTTVSPYKVKWASAAGGGAYTLINSGGTTISGNTTVSSIGGYTHLFFVIEGASRSSGSGVEYWLRFNGDSGANYAWGSFGTFNNSTANSCGFNKGDTQFKMGFRYGSTTNFNDGNYTSGWVYRYGTTTDKAVYTMTWGTDGSPNTTPFIVHSIGAYNTSSAITSITVGADSTLDGGKIYVYGVN
jgi:hypothetical protein